MNKKWLDEINGNYAFNEMSKEFKKYLKKGLKLKNNLELVSFNKGYFIISGFVLNKSTNKYAYFSVPDTRYFNSWYNEILVRTAKDEKDFTGGQNIFCNIFKFIDKMEDITK